MVTQDMREALQVKVSRMSIFACESAIKDCHLTLQEGRYEYASDYAQKLWYEIDLCRERIMKLRKW